MLVRAVVIGLFLGLTHSTAVVAAPVAVGVSQREFRFAVFRDSVPVGPAKLNIHNYGEDGHNLVLYSPWGKRMISTPEVRSGQNFTQLVTFTRPGTYRLVCSIADHAQRGMRSSIRVRSK